MTDKQAYREGACDAILGRASCNPYNWEQAIKMWSYNAGYDHGDFIMNEGRMASACTA